MPLPGTFSRTLCLLGAALLAAGAQAQAPTMYAQDGGTREVLESIFIPPLLHAPFSLTLETEWSRPLANGGTYTLQNRRHIMRDSAGRIHQERWILVPKNGKIPSTMNLIQVSDPSAHTLYNCEVAEKRCHLITYTGSTMTKYQPMISGGSGPLPNGTGFQTSESLGHSSVDGIDTVGYRHSLTVNPWVAGNDQPMVSTREFWYSEQLGISLRSSLETAQTGKQEFTVTEIDTSEPPAAIFKVPAGYTVVDQRSVEPPSN